MIGTRNTPPAFLSCRLGRSQLISVIYASQHTPQGSGVVSQRRHVDGLGSLEQGVLKGMWYARPLWSRSGTGLSSQQLWCSLPQSPRDGAARLAHQKSSDRPTFAPGARNEARGWATARQNQIPRTRQNARTKEGALGGPIGGSGWRGPGQIATAPCSLRRPPAAPVLLPYTSNRGLHACPRHYCCTAPCLAQPHPSAEDGLT